VKRRTFIAAVLLAPLSTLAAAQPSASVPSATIQKIARRYRVSRYAVERMAAVAAEAFPSDPVLLLALIGIESAWRPWAIGAVGEAGLCQIRPDWHGATAAELADPETNIRTAARILRGHVERYGVREGVAKFNGAGPAAARYAEKVLRERHRLVA
jgi:soluble lytic murein transglycosylase-like protein